LSPGIIFMGTPDFAVPTLAELHRNYNVVMVVTQPDRKSGRGRKVMASPVKEAAEAANLPVFQPSALKDPQAVSFLRDLNPDLIVVAAFGQILRRDVLDMPRQGCINIHASLLPRWRGASPVVAAILNGDTETGITLMQMEPGLDTGPIIRQRAMPITPQHTGESLTAELSLMGAELLIETLPDWLNKKITPQPQDDTRATLARRIKKEQGLINWQQNAAQIDRQVRAFFPWPGTFTHWQGKTLKALSVSAVADWAEDLPPGQVFTLKKDIAVATSQGAIILQQVQPAGKRQMSAKSFVAGATNFIGSQLSNDE